jgi:hypothetical protein
MERQGKLQKFGREMFESSHLEDSEGDRKITLRWILGY